MSFRSPVDIANRACQHLGSTRISTTLGFTETSNRANAMAFAYDMLRRPELRSNYWKFATRRALLRALDTTTMLIAPALWSSGTTYRPGAIVTDESNTLWINNFPENLNNDPGNSYFWDVYFGPLTVQLYDDETAYFAGELVYKFTGDGTFQVYVSLQDENEDDPATATAYAAGTTYMKDQLVTSSSIVYISLVDLNLGNTPATSTTQWSSTITSIGGSGSLKWLQITPVALNDYRAIYPAGSGPSSQTATKNVFCLPANFVRIAPQDPKAGANSSLGGPGGHQYEDWLLEGDKIISSEQGPIILRFVADIQDVTAMDDMFCEGLAAKMAEMCCEELTQSTAKKSFCQTEYNIAMGKAKLANAIETGAIEPPEDDWVTCRQ